MFKKAERKQVKLKLALTGPSGSGKTYSALVLAKTIGKRIAFIDTEHESASLYSDRFDFDILPLDPPYTVEKYLRGMKAAQDAGYDVLIVDSTSHQWAGEGGALDQKSALDARGGNSYVNWGKLTPDHERFKSAILQSEIHMICTMRSKQEYVIQENAKGKQAPVKMGMAPIQRDGMEYEFTTVFDIAMDHTAIASKDRTGLFDGVISRITEKTGETLMEWLLSGKPVPEKVRCVLCRTTLLFSAKGDGYYCPRFKENQDGEHTKFKTADLEQFRAAQGLAAATPTGKPVTDAGATVADHDSAAEPKWGDDVLA